MYKLLEEELCRQNANQRHAISSAGGSTGFELCDQSRGGSAIKDAVLLDSR